MNLLFNTRNKDFDDVILDTGQHSLILVKLVVLGADDDSIDALGNTLIAILHRHLALGIRTQVGHHLTFLADVGQGAHDEMGQIEGDRHQALRLVGGIAKHHALIASSLVLIFLTIHATVDVGTLLVDGSENATGVAVKLVLGLGIANLLDSIAGDGLQVDIDIAAHFTHDDHLTCGDKRLASHASLVVISQELVEYCVRDLVGNFVGMSLRHRLR